MAFKHSFALFLFLVLVSLSSSVREKNMMFYMHDIVTGSDITAITVAGVNGSSSNLLGFGTILVIDDVLTEGVDRSSRYVGRAKGIYDNADVNGGAIHMAFSVYFENKRYNGSSLEMFGTDILSKAAGSEVAVVGGTGKFRYARGYAMVKTVAATGLNGIIRFNVTYRLD